MCLLRQSASRPRTLLHHKRLLVPFARLVWIRRSYVESAAGKTIPWYRECCRSVVAVMVWCFWEARCARDGFGPDASAHIPLSKNIHLNQHVRGEEILRERSQRRERAAVTM